MTVFSICHSPFRASSTTPLKFLRVAVTPGTTAPIPPLATISTPPLQPTAPTTMCLLCRLSPHSTSLKTSKTAVTTLGMARPIPKVVFTPTPSPTQLHHATPSINSTSTSLSMSLTRPAMKLALPELGEVRPSPLLASILLATPMPLPIV